VVFGVIPFFHSFGYTMTLWAPLCLGESAVYHFDPLDARRIGELCERWGATTFICTPTMMGLYLRRCRKEQFKTVRNCVLGGEKLSKREFEEICEQLGHPPLEGYGLAETSPVVACNVFADVETPDGRIVHGVKAGTVGMPLPGTEVRIVALDTNVDLPPGKEGMIWVRGPQIMQGYLNRPADTARVIKDGWFKTGDIGFLDEDGFLTITGRLSQFSKIGGEMVPHLAITEQILRESGASAAEVAVTSLPDDKKGERIVVLYSNPSIEPAKLIDQLKKNGLPPLWVPNAANFVHLDQLPILPNGKLDLRALQRVANSALNGGR